MTNASSDRSHGRMPSDEQMDGLLRDFFRMEIPSELNQPFGRNHSESTAQSSLTMSPQTQTVAAASGRRRVAVFSALTALALSLVVFVQSQKPGDQTGSQIVDESESQTNPEAPADDTMLVSPQGDQKAAATVGADGVTLEETDSIELNPRPRD